MLCKLSVVATIGAFALLTNAAIVNYYSDQNCQYQIGQRNVWDNSCATGTGGYQSFKITYPGGSDQMLSAFSRDACAGPWYNCVLATAGNVGVCFNALGGDGGSNAMSSGSRCGVV